jgi:hypothetical protein
MAQIGMQMTKDFALFVTVVVMVISLVGMFLSPLLFKEGGLVWGIVTRKGIITSAVCFGISVFAAFMAVLIDSPNLILTIVFCGGGAVLLGGIYFVSMYLRFPSSRQTYLKIQQYRRGLRQGKDKVDE